MDAVSIELAKKQLIEELSESSVNVLRVRALCRDYPGIIATTGLRIRVWTLLLMGPEYKISSDENRDIKMPDKSCEEQHVLEADGKLYGTGKFECLVATQCSDSLHNSISNHDTVRRTRSEVEDFRSATWRNAVQAILQHFCLSHGIQYKQGMNEVRS
jgi:hypothetical protein